MLMNTPDTWRAIDKDGKNVQEMKEFKNWRLVFWYTIKEMANLSISVTDNSQTTSYNKDNKNVHWRNMYYIYLKYGKEILYPSAFSSLS